MSKKSNQLSLWQAILINMSVMFGAGLFINTVNLTKITGGAGFLSYVVVAFLILPILLVIARLIKYHPSGGFYAYGAHNISKFAGFFSAWSYFVGKLGSATLLIHVFSSLLFTIFPQLSIYIPNPLYIDTFIILLFTWLNLFGLQTGGYVIYLFMIFKIAPVLFAILSGLYLYSQWSLPLEDMNFLEIPITIPLVMYAFIGFEAACSITNSMKNPEKDGPKSLIYSFLAVIGMTISFQFILYNVIGQYMHELPNFLGVFPALIKVLLPSHPQIGLHLVKLLHIAIAIASLGGSYGVMLTNQWNLLILAEHNHTFKKDWFTYLNAYKIPTFCVLAQSIICLNYLWLSQGETIALQQISVLGCTLAYIISILGYIAIASRTSQPQESVLGYTALATSLLLLGTCIRNFYYLPLYASVIVISLMIFGMSMFILRAKDSSRN